MVLRMCLNDMLTAIFEEAEAYSLALHWEQLTALACPFLFYMYAISKFSTSFSIKAKAWLMYVDYNLSEN